MPLLVWLSAPIMSRVSLAADAIVPGIESRYAEAQPPRTPGLPADEALVAAGARIGTVVVDPRAIFDTSVDADDTALFRLANRLHIRTRSSTALELLLFRSGETYDPRLLAESERILRETRYLRDATIRPTAYQDGRVDVEVCTQDVWTLNPGVSFGRQGGQNTSGFEIEELNLLGMGTQLGIGHRSGVDRDSTTVYYRDRHLARSWWALDIQNSDNSDGVTRVVSLDRPFYALDTRWAAGGSVREDQRIDSLYDGGVSITSFATEERVASVYGGWSTGLRAGWVRRWRVGWSLDEHRFAAVVDPVSTTFLPPGRRLVYPWMSFELLQDRFRTLRNRDQIERTEDFELGWRINGLFGYAARTLGSDRNAAIMGLSLANGQEIGSRQLLLWSISAGGRLETGALRNALASAKLDYSYRQSAHRLFVTTLAVDAGRNLDADTQLLLGGDTGLRAFPLRYQSGTGRWALTAEQRWYTNWYPFRLFNVGAAAFFDIGRTFGDGRLTSAHHPLLSDIGIGLRLGANRSALGNVVHIDVSRPLGGPAAGRNWQLGIETKRSF